MNNIGWCSKTWNPVWGCLNNCEYCYARKIAKRFWNQMYRNEFNYYFKKYPNWVWTGDQLGGLWKFEPTFMESQFDKKFPKKSQKIFVGSMSEIVNWEAEWIERVLEKVKQYPQHTFQFLTRYPEIYSNYDFPQNCWLGVTVTYNGGLYFAKEFFKCRNRIRFISIEPILEYIELKDLIYLNDYNWIILGAETGNRKGKVIPKGEWIEEIVNYCKCYKIPIYLKDSLKDIYPVEIKEFPKIEL